MQGWGAAADAYSPRQITLARRDLESLVTESDLGRIYLSTALRSAGQFVDSLAAAESVLARVPARETSYRRLATLEVAASLLSLGESSESRALVESAAAAGFCESSAHELRAAMILAEIDRRTGHHELAVSRIRAVSSYLIADDACWLAAAYCGAFPKLLGVMATAVAPSTLPAQLLRMIPRGQAQHMICEAKSFMEPAAWNRLGRSLVGESEMDRLVMRGNVPLCRVRMFGGLEVRVGDRTIRDRDWTKHKARSLFTLLASRRGQDIPREQILESLWPDMDYERARSNLYVAWSTMKSVLGGATGYGRPSPYVERVMGVCRVDRNNVRSDIDELEAQLAFARAARPVVGRVEALAAYDRVADIYSGGFLPGNLYDDWLTQIREFYRAEFIDAMVCASKLLLDSSKPARAIAFLRRAIQADPLREDLYQRLVSCQIAEGQRRSAILTYTECCERLFEELGVEPSDETRSCYDQILAMHDHPIVVRLDPQ